MGNYNVLCICMCLDLLCMYACMVYVYYVILNFVSPIHSTYLLVPYTRILNITVTFLPLSPNDDSIE